MELIPQQGWTDKQEKKNKPALVMNCQRIIRIMEKNKAGMALEGDGGMGKQEGKA